MNEKDKYIEARDNSIAKLYLEFDLCKNNNPNAFFALRAKMPLIILCV